MNTTPALPIPTHPYFPAATIPPPPCLSAAILLTLTLTLVSLVRRDQLESDLDEKVEHLVLVVHGIGDALMSVDLGVVQLRSLVECCHTMRAHHEEVSSRPGQGGCTRFSRTNILAGTAPRGRLSGFVDILQACTALSRHPTLRGK